MAEINVQWVRRVTSTAGSDVGAYPGGYVYQIRYDMPDLPDMPDHVHSLPLEAIAVLLIGNDSEDMVSAVDFFVREAATSVALSVAARALPTALEKGDPRHEIARLRGAQRAALDASVDAALSDPAILATAAPLLSRHTSEGAQEEVSAGFLDRSMTKPTEVPVPVAAQPYLTARQKTAQELLPVPGKHVIDTSTQGWQDLTGMLGEHGKELRTTQMKMFDARYRQHIMLSADQRLRGSR